MKNFLKPTEFIKKPRNIFVVIISISFFGYLAMQNFGFTFETALFFIAIIAYLFHAFVPHYIKEKVDIKYERPHKKRLIKIAAFTVLGFIIFLLLIIKDMWL